MTDVKIEPSSPPDPILVQARPYLDAQADEMATQILDAVAGVCSRHTGEKIAVVRLPGGGPTELAAAELAALNKLLGPRYRVVDTEEVHPRAEEKDPEVRRSELTELLADLSGHDVVYLERISSIVRWSEPNNPFERKAPGALQTVRAVYRDPDWEDPRPAADPRPPKIEVNCPGCGVTIDCAPSPQITCPNPGCGMTFAYLPDEAAP